MNIVIIGAHGVIGNALFKAFSPLFPYCTGLTTKSAPHLQTVNYDIASLKDYLLHADVVIYCVGISKFAECEQFPEKSLFLNAGLPQEILKVLSPRQTFVYFSSPIAMAEVGQASASHYALHKRKAEEHILQSRHENFLIIRPSKVIESAGIITEWKLRLSRREAIFPFVDQCISPINTAIVAAQLLRLMQGHHRGCYNLSARDRLSYLDVATALCTYFNLDPGLIEARSARDHNPFFFEQDRLDCSEAEKAVGYVPPAAKDIVYNYFPALI